jgi:hypothetical protein
MDLCPTSSAAIINTISLIFIPFIYIYTSFKILKELYKLFIKLYKLFIKDKRKPREEQRLPDDIIKYILDINTKNITEEKVLYYKKKIDTLNLQNKILQEEIDTWEVLSEVQTEEITELENQLNQLNQ